MPLPLLKGPIKVFHSLLSSGLPRAILAHAIFCILCPFQCCSVLCRRRSLQQLAGLPLRLPLPGLSLFSLAGDVHVAIMDRSGQLEVEVIEARGLTPKPGSKSLPGKAEQQGEGFSIWGPAREGYATELRV